MAEVIRKLSDEAKRDLTPEDNVVLFTALTKQRDGAYLEIAEILPDREHMKALAHYFLDMERLEHTIDRLILLRDVLHREQALRVPSASAKPDAA
jgi:hypothetical protein